jgi:hypothetical protein
MRYLIGLTVTMDAISLKRAKKSSLTLGFASWASNDLTGAVVQTCIGDKWRSRCGRQRERESGPPRRSQSTPLIANVTLSAIKDDRRWRTRRIRCPTNRTASWKAQVNSGLLMLALRPEARSAAVHRTLAHWEGCISAKQCATLIRWTCSHSSFVGVHR